MTLSFRLLIISNDGTNLSTSEMFNFCNCLAGLCSSNTLGSKKILFFFSSCAIMISSSSTTAAWVTSSRWRLGNVCEVSRGGRAFEDWKICGTSDGWVFSDNGESGYIISLIFRHLFLYSNFLILCCITLERIKNKGCLALTLPLSKRISSASAPV